LLLVILASIHDKSVGHLVELWDPHDVCVLTCKELSMVGWRHYLNDSTLSTAVVNGKKISNEQIDGVLTRLPYVTETELFHIVNHDRSYVAAEMMAFLVSWLSCLKCPVINKPTPLCLLGPNWSQEQWIHAAAKVGLPVRSLRRQSFKSNIINNAVDHMQRVTVSVIGDHCYGAINDEMTEQSIRLTRQAGVEMLSVHFAAYEKGFLFITANLWFPIDSHNISNAILDYLIESNKKIHTNSLQADHII
jgi:hypothetical protein